MSAFQRAFLDSLALKNAPYRAAADPEAAAARGESPAAILARDSRALAMEGLVNAGAVAIGGDATTDVVRGPTAAAADVYMARSVRSQFKATAVPFGVYTAACTEGTVKGAADAARVASLSATFRSGHRSVASKYGDYFETRRQATIAAHGCSYEEALLGAYPRTAAAMLLGTAEASRACVRYASSSSPEEAYMAASVDAAMKARAVVGGVYAPSCTDGSAGGEAEAKRVAAVAVRFRSAHLPATTRTAARYDAARAARAHYGHGCSYEEALFDKYSAVAAAMRPSTARY